MRTTLMNYARTIIASAVMSVFVLGCEKEEEFINPFSEVQTLDCRNLIIRNVILTENTVDVTLENTCKRCEDGWGYLGMVMIDRINRDTLAQTACLTCFSGPKNGKSETYQLTTELTTLPDLNSMQFNFGYLCRDLTYIKK